MGKKSIVGTGRFGSRYGKRIREEIKKATKTSKKKYSCPSCSRVSIRRESAGVWKCAKCGKKYASGAYKFNE
ncbi:50S ribosomal protein L37ae [archaeon]|nr:50S ribosomal protein L37ae [archaeon]